MKEIHKKVAIVIPTHKSQPDNNEEISLEDLINSINTASKKITEYVTCNFRDGEVFKNYSSYEKAKNQIGFSPKITLQEGINELYTWIKENEFNL